MNPKKSAKKVKLARKLPRRFFYFTLGSTLGVIILLLTLYWHFETTYADKIYPGVKIGSVVFSGKTSDEVTNYWLNKNVPFNKLAVTLQFEDKIATLSGRELDAGFDATLSATQALSVGRSGLFLTDMYQRYTAWKNGINLQPLFKWREEGFNTTLENLAAQIDIAPEDALFEFQNGRVAAFKVAKVGRQVDRDSAKKNFVEQLQILSSSSMPTRTITVVLTAKDRLPLITTEQANNFGIIELIGHGESYFRGSIPGRVHNVALAAARVNGVLIPPGSTFSFNATVGDISAATGYKQAYIIKSGRSVLDDGGGVCQVSTTLFRAALNAGLPIAERHAHSYRVGYYEQGSWKPGFDATVYAPSYDFKITNDMPTHILIQAITDTQNAKLTFELYGKADGRTVELSPVRLTDPQPALPDLNQDDPTLPAGTVKQVDWATPGIKSAFDYKVMRAGEVIFAKTFTSNFIPWQAVFLHGTGPAQ